MPRLLLSFFLIVAFCPGMPVTRSSSDATGRVVEIDVQAPALADNLLGSSVIQDAAVYLQPSYDSTSDCCYPVIYLLHGFFDDYAVWLEVEFLRASIVSSRRKRYWKCYLSYPIQVTSMAAATIVARR